MFIKSSSSNRPLLSLLPMEIILAIISYLPSRFLFDLRCIPIWKKVFSRYHSYHHHDDENNEQMFSDLVFERLIRKIYVINSVEYSTLQIFLKIVSLENKFSFIEPKHFVTFPEQFRNLYTDRSKLKILKSWLDEQCSRKGEEQACTSTTEEFETQNDNESCLELTIPDLALIFEYVSRFNFYFLLHSCQNNLKLLRNTVEEFKEPVDISWTFCVDDKYSTHTHCLLHKFRTNKNSTVQEHLKMKRGICMRIRGQIYNRDMVTMDKPLKNETTIMNLLTKKRIKKIMICDVYENMCVPLPKNNRLEMHSALFFDFMQFIAYGPSSSFHPPKVEEFIIQRYWLPCFNNNGTSSITCRSTENRAFNEIENFLGTSIHSPQTQFFHKWFWNLLTLNGFFFDLSPKASIQECVVTCFPSTKKVLFQLKPKSVIKEFFKVALLVMLCLVLWNYSFLFCWKMSSKYFFEPFQMPLWERIAVIAADLFTVVVPYIYFIRSAIALYHGCWLVHHISYIETLLSFTLGFSMVRMIFSTLFMTLTLERSLKWRN